MLRLSRSASPTATKTRRRCEVLGCPWRGTCPDHSRPHDYDLELAILMRQRPYVSAIAAGVA